MGGRVDRPGDGRQRTLWCAAFDCLGQRTTTEQTGAQSRHIAVEHHGLRGNGLSTGQLHATGAALRGGDGLHAFAIAKLHAALRAQAGQALRQRMHAALHRPHAVHLHLGNEHQGGGGLPR